MSNAATGVWSALGALLGGVAGAAAAKYVVESRPRGRGNRDRASEVEDAMVVGGAAGAVLGSFVAGATMSEPATVPRLAGG
jgi:hypothetical protein